MRKVVLASGNKGKLDELRSILNFQNVQLIAQSEFDIKEAEENHISIFCNMEGRPESGIHGFLADTKVVASRFWSSVFEKLLTGFSKSD